MKLKPPSPSFFGAATALANSCVCAGFYGTISIKKKKKMIMRYQRKKWGKYSGSRGGSRIGIRVRGIVDHSRVRHRLTRIRLNTAIKTTSIWT